MSLWIALLLALSSADAGGGRTGKAEKALVAFDAGDKAAIELARTYADDAVASADVGPEAWAVRGRVYAILATQPDLPRRNPAVKAGDLDQIRSALYPAEPETQSQNVRMRLAASTVDVTLMMVYLPMGAAMLTCSLLRGGDVIASSRVMALTCTLLAFTHVAGLDVVLSAL